MYHKQNNFCIWYRFSGRSFILITNSNRLIGASSTTALISFQGNVQHEVRFFDIYYPENFSKVFRFQTVLVNFILQFIMHFIQRMLQDIDMQ